MFPGYQRTRLGARALSSAIIATFYVALLAASGCNHNADQPPANQSTSPAEKGPANLRLAIVDDPALVKSIDRMKGEWKAQTATTLQIDELTHEQISTTKKIEADAVIYAPALLGTLAERDLIRPVNQSWLTGDPLDSADLIQPLDALPFTWDGKMYAVPLGSPIFVLMYRRDVFEHFGKTPPHTWEEYQALADFFHGQLKSSKPQKPSTGSHSDLDLWAVSHITVEPLSYPWAGRMLLARAAAYARHRDYFSILFDRENMNPLIAGPPWVRALSELAATAKIDSDYSTLITPDESLQQVLSGKALMAIGWPSVAFETTEKSTGNQPAVDVAIAELPGASSAYNPGHESWEPRRPDENFSVPVLDFTGRVGSVVRGAESPQTAFQLLSWLASQRWSTDVLPPSGATSMFRQSQLADPSPWTGPAVSSAAAKQYSQLLSSALHQREAVCAPRLPGEAEYIGALDEAVHDALSGKQSPQQALAAAAEKWKTITARLGEQQQLEAYRGSLKTTP